MWVGDNLLEEKNHPKYDDFFQDPVESVVVQTVEINCLFAKNAWTIVNGIKDLDRNVERLEIIFSTFIYECRYGSQIRREKNCLQSSIKRFFFSIRVVVMATRCEFYSCQYQNMIRSHCKKKSC